MHDIRAIRENPAAFDAALARRGLAAVSSTLLAIDEARRSRILAAETARAAQNLASKEAGAAKGRGDETEFQRLRALVGEKKEEIARLTAEAEAEAAARAEEVEAAAKIKNATLEIRKLAHGLCRVLDQDRGRYPSNHWSSESLRP